MEKSTQTFEISQSMSDEDEDTKSENGFELNEKEISEKTQKSDKSDIIYGICMSALNISTVESVIINYIFKKVRSDANLNDQLSNDTDWHVYVNSRPIGAYVPEIPGYKFLYSMDRPMSLGKETFQFKIFATKKKREICTVERKEIDVICKELSQQIRDESKLAELIAAKLKEKHRTDDWSVIVSNSDIFWIWYEYATHESRCGSHKIYVSKH